MGTGKIYGLPYKGSKNAIARDIIELLPPGRILYDLFGGGGAVTHAALLSGKWDAVLYNDIDGSLPELFIRAAAGDLPGDLYRWISREEFHKRKDTDALVSLCWSFGNDRDSYLYSREREPFCRAYHMAVVERDLTELYRLGIYPPGELVEGDDMTQRYSGFKKWMRETPEAALFTSGKRPQELRGLERLQGLESLQRLESLRGVPKLRTAARDYRDICIEPGGVVYCDIPYEGRKGYGMEFDHEAFYDWACRQDAPVFVSSYEIRDPRFVEIWAKRKTALLGTGNGFCVERVYAPRHQAGGL